MENWHSVEAQMRDAIQQGNVPAAIAELEKLTCPLEMSHVFYWLRIGSVADHSKGEWRSHPYHGISPYWWTPIYRADHTKGRSHMMAWARKWLPELAPQIAAESKDRLAAIV